MEPFEFDEVEGELEEELGEAEERAEGREEEVEEVEEGEEEAKKRRSVTSHARVVIGYGKRKVVRSVPVVRSHACSIVISIYTFVR